MLLKEEKIKAYLSKKNFVKGSRNLYRISSLYFEVDFSRLAARGDSIRGCRTHFVLLGHLISLVEDVRDRKHLEVQPKNYK